MSNFLPTFIIILFVISIVSIIISMHEAAHAYIANRLGDPTAKLLGRITLNPSAHIDPLGTLVVPLILLVLSGGAFVFGWAKPTPINPLNFENPRKDSALTAFAGPASNFILATIIGVVSRLIPLTSETKNLIVRLGFGGQWDNLFNIIDGDILAFIFLALTGIVIFNLILGIFNLIPVPPLDGFRILVGILPKDLALKLATLESYGPIVLILFLFVFINIFSGFISTLITFLLSILVGTTL